MNRQTITDEGNTGSSKTEDDLSISPFKLKNSIAEESKHSDDDDETTQPM